LKNNGGFRSQQGHEREIGYMVMDKEEKDMLMHMKEKEMVTMKESVGNLNFNVKIVISLDILGNVVSMT